MGYVVLAVGVAALVGSGTEDARRVAVVRAETQMVSHGLITAALFLLVGVLRDRAGSYELSGYGGLAASAPKLTTLFAVGAFASLGLPAFSGFIAEFQIFAGAIGTAPVTAVALLGILITAAMFLLAVQRIFTGKTRGGSIGFRDLSANELWSAGPLLALSLLIGVLPRVILDVIEPAAATLAELVGR
jgi:NADH-quinone oxidoreductase subunit M